MIVARAPLRVTLGGGASDLPSYYTRHGGFVIGAAIDKYVHVCVNRSAADGLIRVKHRRCEEVSHLAHLQHDLARSALQAMAVSGGVEVVSLGDVPEGTGLGSSGSYLVALLAALHELEGWPPPTRQALAEQAFAIETGPAGRAAGKQDPYLAAHGGLTCLEIDRDGEVRVEPLPVAPRIADELLRRLPIFFTGITRSADSILAVERDRSEGGDPAVLDSLHRTKELAFQIRDVLRAGDLDAFGRLLHEHWETKKRRAAGPSPGLVDQWYERARHAGALGGKLIGAGGGGFLMAYCPDGTRQAVTGALAAEGLHEVPYEFDFTGVHVVVGR